ncbi:MAG TPA: hypothetical protein DCR46_06715 [Cytophagales bacterium]|nr:hypothetical protein [Cytophagales bacterium]
MNQRELNERIAMLEHKRDRQWEELSTEFQVFYASINLGNLIKTTITNTSQNPEFKSSILNKLTDLLNSYLSKKVAGENASPTRKAVVAIGQYLITDIVAKKSDSIIALSENVIRQFLSRKNKKGAEDK